MTLIVKVSESGFMTSRPCILRKLNTLPKSFVFISACIVCSRFSVRVKSVKADASLREQRENRRQQLVLWAMFPLTDQLIPLQHPKWQKKRWKRKLFRLLMSSWISKIWRWVQEVHSVLDFVGFFWVACTEFECCLSRLAEQYLGLRTVWFSTECGIKKYFLWHPSVVV